VKRIGLIALSVGDSVARSLMKRLSHFLPLCGNNGFFLPLSPTVRYQVAAKQQKMTYSGQLFSIKSYPQTSCCFKNGVFCQK
jgi:hypothetical protein